MTASLTSRSASRSAAEVRANRRVPTQGAQTLAREGAPWPAALQRSLGLLLKEQEDLEHVAARPELLGAGAGA